MNCLVHRSEPCDSPVNWLCGECYGRMNSRFPGKIDNMRPFVFLHMVKCGGTSVEHALNIPLKLQTARSLIRSLGPEQWAKIFSFSVVRNPWDRVASLYHFHLKNEHHFRRRYEVKNFGGDKVPFSEWLALVREKVPGKLGVDDDRIASKHWEFNDWVRLVYGRGIYEEFRYTKNWCYENNADTLSDPKTGNIAVSFVARLERIQTDFKVICGELGIEAELPHHNISVREKTKLTDLYEPDTIELVRKTFARDVKVFGYEFGG